MIIQDKSGLLCSEVYFDNLLSLHRRISYKVSIARRVYSFWLGLGMLKEKPWHDGTDPSRHVCGWKGGRIVPEACLGISATLCAPMITAMNLNEKLV